MMIPMEGGAALQLEPPNEDEREWLLDGLRNLIQRRGFEHFVGARIVQPTSEDFPDRVPKGPTGARVLLRRLLAYAGLGELRVRLQTYREQSIEFDQHGRGHAGPGAAAWFAGIHDGICEFGVNASELRDAEELIGSLGHEVAHAFRQQYGLVAKDAAVEERLTDLTTVYLGFGVFLLNSSLSFKTGGYSESGERLLYQKQQRGYLSPPQLAFLLATQFVARGIDGKKRKQLVSALAPNHEKLFFDSCDLLPPAAELRSRLGVPEQAAWGDLTAYGATIELESEDEVEEEAAPAEPSPPAASSVLRVRGSQASALGLAAAIAPFFGAFFGLLEGWLLLGSVLFGATLGAVVGSQLNGDSCSGCRGRLPRGASQCPRCNGQVVRTIATHDERLDVEELLQSQAESSDDDEKLEPSVQLITAIYAAWLIERGHISAALEERFAELVVRVRCGTYPTEELAAAWGELQTDLTEPATRFMDYYFGGTGTRPVDADFQRLTSGVEFGDTAASYRRVLDVLDARFASWSKDAGEDSLSVPKS